MRKQIFSLLVLGLIFTACAPSQLERNRFNAQEIITDFAPDRGNGATYKIGELVKISFTLSQPGYITLISMDPDTTTGEVEYSIAAKAGKNNLPRSNETDATGARAAYKVFPPTGTQRIVLLYTNKPVRKNIRFEGQLDNEALSEKIAAYFETSQIRDVSESSIEVEK